MEVRAGGAVHRAALEWREVEPALIGEVRPERHEFHQHHAQSDAEAAARVLLVMMKQANANTPSELLQEAGLVPRRFCQ